LKGKRWSTTQKKHTTTQRTQFEEVTISNHTITTNTTYSSEQIFQTHHTLPFAQLADIAAHHSAKDAVATRPVTNAISVVESEQ